MKETNEIKIDKNVPIPKSRKEGYGIKYPFGEMDIGDSFEIKANSRKEIINIRGRIFSACSYYNKLTTIKIKITTRLINNKIRCWRIK